MLQRITYGALAISILFALIAGDVIVAQYLARADGMLGKLLSRGSLLPLSCAVVSGFACLELAALMRRIGSKPCVRWAVFCSIVLVLAPWLSAAGVFGLGPVAREGLETQMILLAAAFLGAGIVQLGRRDISRGLSELSCTWMLIVYTGLLPSFLVMMRCDVNVPVQYGPWLVLVFLAVCKSSDIGAYFIGSLFGRHKLIPHVSPGKSVEGAFGGILASVSVAAGFLAIARMTIPDENPLVLNVAEQHALLLNDITTAFAGRTWAQVITLGVVTSICGQLGDLIESVFKRSAEAKDSAQLLPGFGGLLDMVDSPFAAAPVVWFIVTRLWNLM